MKPLKTYVRHILRFSLSSYFNCRYFLCGHKHISLKGIFWKSRIKSKGKNNRIEISGDCYNLEIVITGSSNLVSIGNRRISNSLIVIHGDDHRIIIDDERDIRNLEIRLFDSETSFQIGKNTGIGGARVIVAGKKNFVTIGENSMIADHCEIWASDTHPVMDEQSGERLNPDKPIVIGDNVWVGVGCAILKGSTIGAGSLIGMHSTVTSSIPRNCIAVGCPARVVREGVRWKT